MSITPTRTAIVEAFERHRATPGAPYDDSHFLDFLMKSPKTKGAFRNSFVGLRRFNAFIDEVQYQYGVCFSLDDRDRDHSVERFVDRIKKLQNSRQGSLRSLKSQEHAGAGWGVIVVVDAILIGISANLGSKHLAIAVVAIAVAVTLAFSVFAYRAEVYLKRLRSRIEEAT